MPAASWPLPSNTSYSFISLDPPGATLTLPLGINDAGEVVGSYTRQPNPPDPDNVECELGFHYSHKGYLTLRAPWPVARTETTSINNAGQIVGTCADHEGSHGILFEKGQYFRIDADGTRDATWVAAINNAGQIVGQFRDRTGKQMGFVQDGTAETILNARQADNGTVARAINDRGIVCGYFTVGRTQHGFIHDQKGFTVINPPSPAGARMVQGINVAGIATGITEHDRNGTRYEGFLYDSGVPTPLLGPDGKGQTATYGINSAGVMSGTSNSTGISRCFVTDGVTYILLEPCPGQPTYLGIGQSINARGQVVGSYFDGSRWRGFLATT